MPGLAEYGRQNGLERALLDLAKARLKERKKTGLLPAAQGSEPSPPARSPRGCRAERGRERGR